MGLDNDFIPMMWKQETSPGYDSRFIGLYGGGGLPSLIFGGVHHTNAAYNYDEFYDILKAQNSPMFIDGYLEDIGNDQIKATARFKVATELVTLNNKAAFILTNHDGDPLTHSIEIDKSDDIDLTIYQIGDEVELEHTFDLNATWLLENMRVVVLAQSWQQKTILQATELEIIDAIEADFITEIAIGPPSLKVIFQNRSNTILDLDLVEWDFDGDGVFDSNEDHPVHYYNVPGNYDVTLRISKDGVTEEITKEDFIIVTEPDNINGAVGGVWTIDNSPYVISDDIYIPLDFSLLIEAGTELIFEDGACLYPDGVLQAIGTREEPVVFTSNSEWGGIKIIDSYNEMTIDYCIISKSTGAIYVENAIASITNNQIVDNTASSGNAPAIQLVNCDEVEIKQNFISRNHSSSYVGGLGFIASEATVLNNLIVNNSGSLASSIGLEENSVVEFINNTIAYNEGSAAAFVHTSELIVLNSVIWQDANLFIQIGCVPDVSYSCLSSNFNGTGNIFDDPQFTNPPLGWGIGYFSQIEDWIYLDTSACIDAGNPDESYNDNEDPDNPGNPLYPAQGTLTNDIGIFGGIGFDFEMNLVESDNNQIPINQPTLTNYPNPFNPSTTISFSINSEINENAELVIYNLRGQKIKKLDIRNLRLGINLVVWDGTDDNNKSVSSGVYFCRLHTGSKAVVTKLMLIK